MRGIRRKERAITDEDEMKDILKSTEYITIAMCKANKPYLATLSHGYDPEQNAIFFHCANEGKKIDYLKSNDMVWGQATKDMGYVQGKCSHKYASTQFKGKITFLKSLNQKKQALITMIQQLDENPELVIERDLTKKSIQNVTVGRIDIEYLSGKRSDHSE